MKCEIEIKMPYPSPLYGSVKELFPLLEEAYITLGKLREIVAPYLKYPLKTRNNYKGSTFRVDKEYPLNGGKVNVTVYTSYFGELIGEVTVMRGKNEVRIASTILLKDSKDPLEDLLQAMEWEYNRLKAILYQLTLPLQGDVEVVIK